MFESWVQGRPKRLHLPRNSARPSTNIVVIDTSIGSVRAGHNLAGGLGRRGACVVLHVGAHEDALREAVGALPMTVRATRWCLAASWWRRPIITCR